MVSLLLPACSAAVCWLALAFPASSPAQAPACSTTGTLATAFDSSGATGSIAAGEATCYALQDIDRGDYVHVALNSQGGGDSLWEILGGSGQVQCSGWDSGDCSANGAGPFTLRIRDYYTDRDPIDYSIAARRLTNPQGCLPLGEPQAWSFASPRIDGSTSSSVGASCFTFTRSAGEADGAYWFRALRTAGQINPQYTVYGPSGAAECASYYSGSRYSRCELRAAGRFAVIVDDAGSNATGSFALQPKKVRERQGCGSISSVAFGTPAVSATISPAGEADCYDLPDLAADDAVQVGFRNTGTSGLSWSLVDDEGVERCSSTTSADCRLSGAGSNYSVLVYDTSSDATTGSYSLVVRRLNAPQSCQDLGAPGAFSFSAPRTNGSISGPLDARCFTFNRTDGDDDAAFWIRALRTSGQLSPEWAVYGPTGSRECAPDYQSRYSRCELRGVGQFSLVIEDSSQEHSGGFALTARRTSQPSGCGSLPASSFSANPTTGQVNPGTEADCFAVPDVSFDDYVTVNLRASGGSQPMATVIDGNGREQCRSSSTSECRLGGDGQYWLLVHDESTEPSSYSYSTSVQRLTRPDGCTSLGTDDVWSFTGPKVEGTIDAPLAARCFTFVRALGDPDATYWFRTLRASGDLDPDYAIYGPGGDRVCSRGWYSDYSPCRLRASGAFTLVVRDSALSHTGTFFTTPRRTTAPGGCSSLPSVAFGVAPVSGKISTAGEVDCYRLSASQGDQMTFQIEGTIDRLSILNDQGDEVCTRGYLCSFSEDGSLTLLVYPSASSATGTYRFEATCGNPPCGQSNTSVAEASPNRLGAGEFVSTLLRGRDLQLLEDVVITKGSTTIPGEVREAAQDGRSVEVRFDLASAPTGNYDVHATFLDGTERVLPGGLLVQTPRPADLSVQIIGRDVFRAGRPATIEVVLSNAGNIDAVGVPAMIDGIPAGSVVEPQFATVEPISDPANPTVEPAAFDPAVDVWQTAEGLGVPLLASRVPAGRSVSFSYTVTPPTAGTDYVLTARVANCMNAATSQTSGMAATGRMSAAAEDPQTEECSVAFIKGLVSSMPLGDCAVAGGDLGALATRYLVTPVLDLPGKTAVDDQKLLEETLVDGLQCAITPLTSVIKASKTLYKGLGLAKDIVGAGASAVDILAECSTVFEANMPQRQVNAFDPNEIVGPAGSGDERYIAGDTPLDYKILFENLPAATAPAQRVAITDQLDTSIFNPSSVLFNEIRFGSEVYSLPYPEHEIDDTIDLRPDQDLLVHATSSVTPAGKIEIVLQAIDPETLEPPDDPLAGFLPPNVESPEGEGHVSFSAGLKALPSGTSVTNRASIVFDSNAPIETPTWTNVIDKAPPTVGLDFLDNPGPLQARLGWSGADDAAGVRSWELRVAEGDGPFTIWDIRDQPGNATYTADEPGTYRFRALARDGAGNVALSTQVSVSLEVDRSPPDTAIDSGPANGATITTTSATFGFHGTPAADTDKVMCKIDSSAFAPCASPKTFTGLGPGTHTVSFRAQDGAGNVDPTPAQRSFAVKTPVDTTAPDTVVDAGPANGATIATSSATFAFHGTPSNDTARVQCKVDSGSYAPCSSPRTFTSLTAGAHTISFRAEDAVGNADASPAQRTITVRSETVDCVALKTAVDSAKDAVARAKKAVRKAKKSGKKAKIAAAKKKLAKAQDTLGDASAAFTLACG